jgi:hypothetical protein
LLFEARGLPGRAEQKLECARGGPWDVFAAIDFWRQSAKAAEPPECLLLSTLDEPLSVETPLAVA